MKIAIACTAAGAGHVKAAEALYNYLKSREPSFDLALIDVLEESDFLFRKAYSSGYSFMVHHAQWLWKLLFYITAQKKLQPTIQRFRVFNNKATVRNFIQYLLRAKPDVVIATHFLPSAITAYLKEAGRIQSRLITVITDYGVHPFWVYDRTDLYAVASLHTRRQLLNLGVGDRHVKVTGIPVDSKFQQKKPRIELCQKFGLDPDQFVLLIVTGSFGIGPIEPIVKSLYRHVQILVVCARNKRLYKRLQVKKYPRVHVFGFVDNIEELMSVADVIVTKPGGLGIAELLAMEVPPIFISVIPGQEAENVKILAEYGIGESIGAADIADRRIRRRVRRPYAEALAVKRLVLDYRKHPHKLKEIKERIRRIRKPHATEEIYHALR